MVGDGVESAIPHRALRYGATRLRSGHCGATDASTRSTRVRHTSHPRQRVPARRIHPSRVARVPRVCHQPPARETRVRRASSAVWRTRGTRVRHTSHPRQRVPARRTHPSHVARVPRVRATITPPPARSSAPHPSVVWRTRSTRVCHHHTITPSHPPLTTPPHLSLPFHLTTRFGGFFVDLYYLKC